MRVGHLVVRILLHERNDPLADGLPAVHHAEYMLHVCAVLGEQVRERVVVGGGRALIRAREKCSNVPLSSSIVYLAIDEFPVLPDAGTAQACIMPVRCRARTQSSRRRRTWVALRGVGEELNTGVRTACDIEHTVSALTDTVVNCAQNPRADDRGCGACRRR